MWKWKSSARKYLTRASPRCLAPGLALRIAAALAATVLAATAQAAAPGVNGEPTTAEEALLVIRDAAARGDLERAERYRPMVQGHLLAAYAEYWPLRARLTDPRLVPPGEDELKDFVARHAGEYVVERLRNDWLLHAGKQRDWKNFDEQYAPWAFKDDAQVECFALLSRRLKGDDIRVAARQAFLIGNGGDGCNALADQLLSDDGWKAADAAELARRSMEVGNVAAARRFLPAFLSEREQRSFEAGMDNPVRWIARGSGTGREGHEVALLVAIRAIRNDPQAACPFIERTLASRLGPRDWAELQAQCGQQAARRLLPEALDWYRGAGTAAMSDEGYAWAVRAGLRGGTAGRPDWRFVQSVIERMPASMRRDPAWIYWWGRALAAQGHEDDARAAYHSIAGQPHFYGQLAAEEVGQLTILPPRPPAPTPEELATVRASIGIQRALKFYELGLKLEGHREWNYALRGMNDRLLLAAAEYARQLEYFDRTVNTADRTRVEHDYLQRFLTPFRDLVSAKAEEIGVDPAWVYGLIRQESRFALAARSSAGAAGLMQVMPATARWVARRIGLNGYHPGQVTDMETNVVLGTAYLRMVLDDLDGSAVLASAAYNAGPARAKSWRATLPRAVEGAIFAETIPFTETRDYVKKVLSNATFYAALLSGEPQSLKARLGQVSPRKAVQSDLP